MIGQLVTFGYAGLGGSADLRDHLRDAPIDLVVDVRLNAFSRNLAFSRATRHTVEAAGFRYLHLRDLGNVAYRTGGTKIRNVEAIERVLDELRAGHSVALMCGCSRYQDCHRQDLALAVGARLPGVFIRHRPPHSGLDPGG